MMVKLLVYAYCTGKPSSRKIERATYEDVAYRVLAADQHPDHDSIAAFRQRHLPALAGLFAQGLPLCQEAGLVKLGHVALDGTKIKANASKHKAMSYERMCAAEQQLEQEGAAVLARAQDGATKGFEQAYNAQAAVDAHAQIIVAVGVTQEATDKHQRVPLVMQVEANCGALPAQLSADAGYFSAANVTAPGLAGVDLYVPPDRQKHGAPPAGVSPPPSPDAPVSEQMRHKLTTPEGREIYGRRKTVVEPVFGQTKEGRGFRRFSFRGLRKVTAEWALICLTHNLLKLFRAGPCPQVA